MNAKKIIHIIIGFLPFSLIRVFCFNLIKGNKISYSSMIGWGFYGVNKIVIEEGCLINSFNFFYIDILKLNKYAFIKYFNLFKGPFDIFLDKKAGVSKKNKISRASFPITYGKSKLHLGYNTIIVSNHFLDLTNSIIVGDNSIIAGSCSQLWTHGFYHADLGPERIRIDGGITIGNNVYIGSSCVFNPGVNVGNAINIGAGSVISRDLKQPGMYVNQGLRFIDNNIEKVKSKLEKVEAIDLVEQVYLKK
jgi:acetyltransferase-like isoleucine patch superfamily enzyme